MSSTAAPAAFSPALAPAERAWPETNCFLDLIATLLALRGLEPRAALGFTVRQDFEGDHFTFSKQPAADLERLYGLLLQETAIYDRLEAHALVQAARGSVMLVEVDSFYLPDLAATDYRRAHGKTSIGILGLDPAARRLDYVHNTAAHVLTGEDYDGLFPPLADPAALPPYAEMLRPIAAPLRGRGLVEAARELLSAHLTRRPQENPVLAFKAALGAQADELVQRPLAVFHRYAFNTSRQFGANFEQLGLHLDWLGEVGEGGLQDLADLAGQAHGLAAAAKAFQFQLARAFGRRSAAGLADRLDGLAQRYDALIGGLAARCA